MTNQTLFMLMAATLAACGDASPSNDAGADLGTSSVDLAAPSNDASSNDLTTAMLPDLLAYYPLTITITNLGTATGSVTASPTGTSCGSGCLQFPAGTTVTLTQSASPGHFLRWGGDCSGSTACSVDMTSARTVSATFAQTNIAFISSDTFYPTSGNPATSVDGHCQALATTAGIAGTYVGWLGTDNATFGTRLGTANGWIRLDGKPFAKNKAALLASHTLYPNRITEQGIEVPGTTAVLSDIMNSCAGFTKTTGSVAVGLAGGGWLGAAIYNGFGPLTCGTPLPIYCFGVDYTDQATYTPAVGRRAFATKSPVALGGGVAALDAACNSKASAASFTGTFAALVPTTTATAASRFSTTGSAWVRADGIPLVASAADLFASPGPMLISTLEVAEDGSVNNYLVVGGASDLNSVGTAASTCSNYTDNTTATSQVITGFATFPTPQLISGSTDPCTGSYALYCLEK